MTKSGRASLFALCGLALVVSIPAGCSTNNSTGMPQPQPGGAGGSSPIGGSSTGGASTGGASTGGASTGGASTGGSDGGNAGSATAGTAGTAGTGGTAGTAGAAGTAGTMSGPPSCTVLPVVSPVIYEFPGGESPGAGGAGGAGGEPGAGGAPPVATPIPGFSFGYTGNVFSGYSFFYPNTLASDISEGDWHVSGTVGAYAGFQIGFLCGADASNYKGISFKISGDAGPSGSLSFVLSHAADAWRDPNSGTATPAKCMAPAQYDGTCQEAAATVEVGAEQTVTLLWADFAGGRPEANPDPAELMAFRWLFNWNEAKQLDPAANEYDVDVRLDDLTFIE